MTMGGRYLERGQNPQYLGPAAVSETQGAMIHDNRVSADRLLGFLAQTLCNLYQAMIHFDDALTFCRNGYRPELARTCCDYVDMLKERGDEGDRAKAIGLLDESLAISANWACNL